MTVSLGIFCKKTFSSLCILSILHSSLWSAVAPIEYDPMTRIARVRAYEQAATYESLIQQKELIDLIQSGRVDILENHGKIMLPSSALGRLKVLENYDNGVVNIEAEGEHVVLPELMQNEGLFRIHGVEDLHVHAQQLFNQGEFDCIDDRTGDVVDPLRWQLHGKIKNKGAILGDVVLVIGDLERTLEELEGIIIGQDLVFQNITHLKAFTYAGYGRGDFAQTKRYGTITYNYNDVDETGEEPTVEGAVFSTGLAHFVYNNVQSARIGAFLNVAGARVSMNSGDFAELYLEREEVAANPVLPEDLGALKALLDCSPMEQLQDLWPLLRIATEAPSSIGDQGLTISFGGEEEESPKGNVYLGADYQVAGPVETKNVSEFQVLNTGSLIYQNHVTLDAEDLLVAGIFRLDDNPLLENPVFNTQARFLIKPEAEFKADQLVYYNPSAVLKKIVHGNEGVFVANVLHQNTPFYLRNSHFAAIKHVSGGDNTLHVRNNEGYVLSSAPLVMRYTADYLNKEGPITGYVETAHEKGIGVVLDGHPDVVNLSGVFKSPKLWIKGHQVRGTGLLDAASVIFDVGHLDTKGFHWGDHLQGLMITSQQKLSLSGGNTADGFALGGHFSLSGPGSVSLKTPIQARAGVAIHLDGPGAPALGVVSGRISSSEGPVHMVAPRVGFHEENPQTLEGTSVLIQTNGGLGDDGLKLGRNISFRTPHKNGQVRIKSKAPLTFDGFVEANEVSAESGENLFWNPKSGSRFKKLFIKAKNRADLITNIRARGLEVSSETFIPSGSIHVGQALIESDLAVLGRMRFEADSAKVDAETLRSHRAMLRGKFLFEGETHAFTDLDAWGANITFTGAGTSVRGKSTLGKADFSAAEALLLEGGIIADFIAFPIEAKYLTLLGAIRTRQKEIRAGAENLRVEGTLVHEGEGGFDDVALTGGAGTLHMDVESRKISADFKDLDASQSHLKAENLTMRAHNLMAHSLFLEAMNSVIAGDTLDLSRSRVVADSSVVKAGKATLDHTRLEGGVHVVTTAAEAKEAEDALTAAAVSHEASTLTGTVDLTGTTISAKAFHLYTGDVTGLAPEAFETDTTHVSLENLRVRDALKLAHALAKSDRVTVDARRSGETLYIQEQELWRPNITMEATEIDIAPGAAVRSEGDLGLIAVQALRAARAKIEARNILLAAREGTIDLVATQVRAMEDAVLEAAKDVKVTSVADRDGSGENYTDHKVTASIEAARQLAIRAGGNIQFTSVDTSSGTGTTFQAGGQILDFALDLVTQRTHHHRRGYTRDKWTHRAPSSHTSGGDFVSEAGFAQHLFAPRIKAKKVRLWGEEGVNVYEVHDEHEHESHYKKKGGWFSSSKEVHTKSHTATSKRASITAEEEVYIGSRKDVNLTNIHLVVPKIILESLEGNVRLLLGTNYHSYFQTVKNSNIFWQGQGYNLEEHKTYSASSFSGDVEILAKEALVQQVKGKTLEFLDRVKIVDGKITFEFLEEFHKFESDYKDGPSAALAAVVAIAISIATAGAGSALGAAAAEGIGLATAATTTAAATTTTAGVVVSGMTSAAFGALCSQAGVALLSAKGDIGQALKSLASTNTLKSIAFSAITAGVTSGVGHAYGIELMPSKLQTFGDHLKAQTLRTGVGAGMGIVAGEKPENALLGGVKSAIAGAITASLAREIGKAYTPDDGGVQAIDPISHKFFHALVGGLGGAMTGDDPGRGAAAGAMGAFVAETVADMFAPEKPTFEKIKEEERKRGKTLTPAEFKDFYDGEMRNYGKALDRIEDFSKISAAMSAMLTYQDVNTAAATATNALDNNFLVLAWYGVMACSVAYDAYQIYNTFEEKGWKAGLEKLGISVGMNLALGAGGRVLVKIKGVDKVFNSVGEAISVALDKIPGAKTVLGKWVGKITAQVEKKLDQGRKIELTGGFYQAEGSAFKFSEYYYKKLWETGRGAPFLQAEEMLKTAKKIVPDRKLGFHRYENDVFEMIYNPTTREVWHIQPLRK